MNLISAIYPACIAILDTLLPPACLACDAPVDSDGQFCLPCFRSANFVTSPFCAHCGVPLPFEAAGQDGACSACTHAPPLFTAARSALRYDALTKKLILPFKYADRPEAAKGIAVLMARAGAQLLAGADILVPVPLHKTRLRRRRYNQAALLAAVLGRRSSRLVLRDALVRLKPTAPLGGMGVEERQTALTGAIAPRPARAAQLADKNVLLIDDVMTSGATANACAAALLAAGAIQVNVLTAARVADPRYD
jgi:ComF family protein